MKQAFWKIPKEWVQEYGLTWTEAGVLADILSYPTCTVRERAARCGVSVGKISACYVAYNKHQICSKIEHKNVHILNTLCSYSEQKRSKNEQKRSYSEQNKEISPTPPIKNIEETEKIIEEILPSASDGGGEKTVKKREKKYTPEEQKYHGELRDIFLAEWKSINGDDFEMSAANMVAIIKLKNSLKFKLKSDGYNSDDLDFLKNSFQHFIRKTLSGDAGEWLMRQDPKVIASKFNTIYTTLRNGKASTKRQQGVTDEFIRRTAERLAESGGLAF